MSSMAAVNKLTFQQVSEVLEADFELGLLFWKNRPRAMFATDGSWKIWNKRFSGKAALNSNHDGYRAGAIFYQNYRAHRVIWLLAYGEWPAQEIDHIDGNRSNNKLRNLRDVSSAENSKNLAISAVSKTGIYGVAWSKDCKKWYAKIRSENRIRHLGYFKNIDDAIAARRVAEKDLGFHENHGRAA